MTHTSVTLPLLAPLRARPTPPPPALRLVAWYLLASWVVVLLAATRLVAAVEVQGPAAWLFAGAALGCYSAVYLAPVAAPALLACWRLDRTDAGPGARWATLGLVTLGATAVEGLLLADTTVFRVFGFHLNAFVWNIVRTPGGIESLGGGESTYVLFGSIAAGALALNAGLLLLVRWLLARYPTSAPAFTPRRVALGVVALALLGAGEQAAFGLASLWRHGPVLTVAGAFPVYLSTTFGHFARRWGFAPERGEGPRMRTGTAAVRYPLAPLRLAPDRRRLNVVVLVSESLRADMVDPRIMPHTHAFARRAQWFRNHLSGGNGTRMGMFGLFYGLYGAYWFPFLAEHRAPVLLDHLRAEGYRFECRTSAVFTYPEFDQTVFASVPPESLKIGSLPLTWQRDRAHIDGLLEFIGADDPRPFFAFQFFEGPHARYQFPPEAVIEPDYIDDFDYATFGDPDRLREAMPRIKARYVNACHALDAQVGRVLDRLEERGLLDSTLVVITGDHGEEFLEHGRWGHNSAFVSSQMRPPLVLHVPGAAAAERTDLTSHLDVTPTLLTALGVVNPASDYSQGHDLLGPERRRYAVLADWYSIAVAMGPAARDVAVYPLSMSVGREEVRRDDAIVDDPGQFHEAHREELLEVMRGLRTFAAPR